MRFLLIIVALASAMTKDENKDCDDNQHFEVGFHNVIGEDNGQDVLENPEQGSVSVRKPLEKEGEEKDRELMQMQLIAKDIENPDEENGEAFEMDEEERENFEMDLEREPKQLQFSRLMERSVPFTLSILSC